MASIPWGDILGSIAGGMGGGVLGWLGAIGTKVMEMRERRLNHTLEMERLDKTQKIDTAKAAAILAELRERSSGESFTAAIQAEGALDGAYPWVNATMKLWRPAITLALVIIAHVSALIMGFYAGDWSALIAIVAVDSGLMSTALGYWFGRRDFGKASA